MNNNIDEFLLTEYRNISEAHYKTNEAISSFFRYYLLIMTAPIPVLALGVSLSSEISGIITILEASKFIIAGILFVISLAGLSVMPYIINLRMDAVLYARTVNSIRKHFYDGDESISFDTKLKMRVLPQTQSQPSYFERCYFLPVIVTFGIFTAFYMSAALVILFMVIDPSTETIKLFQNIPLGVWFIPFVFLVFPFLVYLYYANYRENTYLRTYSLGVDIDGVLNTHREHFCELLKTNTGISVQPDNITTIPLHDCPALGVERENEKNVFNDVKYWKDMPIADDVAENINKIKRLKLKLHVFSHRPWPDTSKLEKLEREKIYKIWNEASNDAIQYTKEDDPIKYSILWIRCRLGFKELPSPPTAAWYLIHKHIKYYLTLLRVFVGSHPIEYITKAWLKNNGLIFDSMTIEKGNENVADPQGHFKNRFYISRKKKIRYFVEDDMEKAKKLAYICDAVFLIEHPYNTDYLIRCKDCKESCKREKIDLPANVIGVKSWNEISKYIRALS